MRHLVSGFLLAVIFTINLVNAKDDNIKDGILICHGANDAMKKEALASLRKESKDVDEKIKCIFSCHLKSLKVLRDDGSIDEDVMLRNFVPITTQPYIEDVKGCLRLKSENLCDKAFIITACLLGIEDRKP